MALKIGDIAPDFSLYSSEKKLVHLHELRGQTVVLLFYPLACGANRWLGSGRAAL